MRTVFVDSAAWIALINSRDELHEAATGILATLRRERARLLTTQFVLLEVADALSSPGFRQQTVGFVDGLRSISTVEVVPVSPDLFELGWSLFAVRSDKEWSLTDCISFRVMQERKLIEAFTSDSHYTQAGFVKLLSISSKE